MKPALDDYYKDIQFHIQAEPEHDVLFNHAHFTDMMMEASCIIDFQKRIFKGVGAHGFFLCGYSLEAVKNMGYEFFNEVIHPDDLSLWVEMHHAILKCLYEEYFTEQEVHYFSCTFRIKSSLWVRNSPGYLMAYLKLKPVWVKGRLKYGLCLFSSSVIRTSGNLHVYFKNKPAYGKYLSNSKKWIEDKVLRLSFREREILMLAKQGKSREEMAETMDIDLSTVNSTITKLFEKINVTNIVQAIIYATNHRLIYDATPATPKTAKIKNKVETKSRNVLTPDDLDKIQAKLDRHLSVNSIARIMKKPESTIRNALKAGKIVKRTKKNSH